ncbi:uncharacterized protein LOC134772748 isoform X1 [Penaeus indicus]|uniref:uncharacterized protein LOC134772748 isoform X1 n=1 Tax=Penaeus indicus TaxID=29960 RepID=UPI00300D530C
MTQKKQITDTENAMDFVGSAKRALRWCPTRAMRRGGTLLLLWCSFCYLVFRFSGQDESAFNHAGTMTGRLLLQKIVETRAPPVATTEASSPNATTEFNPHELEPSIDKSPSLSEKDLAAQIQGLIPNLPVEYWQKYKGKVLSKNKTCAKFPSLYDISFNNMYWQTLQTSNGTFHLYGAYYDNRTLVAMKPVIRVLGMINRLEPRVKTFCQLWFDGYKEPVFAKVWEYKYIWYKKWGNYKNGLFQPYLIACQVPPGYRHLVPESVSLVERPCDMATTNLRVINNRPPNGKKEDFAVCVKGLDFLHDDLSVRLVEWLEMLFLLGAHKVFLYDLEVHPNISKVLNYYEEQGRVEVTKLTLPGEQPNIPGLIHMYLKSKVTNKRQNELIPYNDCLYKNMYRYKYIALLDTDEVIMPKSSMTWKSLMETVVPKALKTKKDPRASYNVRNVYFMDTMRHTHGWFREIPHYMHMLQHVYRSRNYTKPGQYVKCFHDPGRVLTLHNHFPLSCLGGGCSSYAIDTEDAHLQHYRADCVTTLKKSCSTEYKNHTILDTTIWRYREPLVGRVTDTLVRLGFFNPGTASRPNDPPASAVRRK